VGLSWDSDVHASPGESWRLILAEIEQAEALGFDSVWLREGRELAADCGSPTLMLTYAAQRTRSLQLRSAGRRISGVNPVRLAEEIAVLDNFSRGRAGVAFAPAAAQSVAAGHVHEVIDFVTSAWSADELRYRGEHLRFPAHTGEEAPRGASEPEARSEYVPQWEWGPLEPDFLAVTPKPYASRPPVCVEIDDDETLDWAARSGVSPMLGPDLPTRQAIDRLARYRARADAAGRGRAEVEVVLERRLGLDGPADECRLGGGARALVVAIRELRAKACVSHFVWRRRGAESLDLYRFASEVQTLLQA
jgi:alkanesulfonate monooxygenase SsuD/methylene tetrahydromethanopterin reductase-like flavin-dependent oxidoreductase (luciferase family)